MEGTIDGRIGPIGCFLSFPLEGRTRTIADGSEEEVKHRGPTPPVGRRDRSNPGTDTHPPMEKGKMGNRNGVERDPRPFFQTKVHPPATSLDDRERRRPPTKWRRSAATRHRRGRWIKQ